MGAIVLQGYTVSKALDIDKKAAFKLIKGGARTYYMCADTEAEMNGLVHSTLFVRRSHTLTVCQPSFMSIHHNMYYKCVVIME